MRQAGKTAEAEKKLQLLEGVVEPEEFKELKRVSNQESERKLSAEQMRPVEGVVNDKFLRASSPQEFVGDMRGWLGQQYPLLDGKSVKMVLLENNAQARQLQKTWQNQLQKDHGFSLEDARTRSQVRMNAGGSTFLDTIALTPQTMNRIQSKSLSERIVAAKTIAHEWWHAMRRSQKGFKPFEEGSADVFSEMVMHRRLGAEVELNHAYKDFQQGAEALRGRFGDDWFLASRQAVNQKQYLRQSFEKAGFDKQKIDKVLEAYYDVDSDSDGRRWAEAVQDMLKHR